MTREQEGIYTHRISDKHIIETPVSKLWRSVYVECLSQGRCNDECVLRADEACKEFKRSID